MNQPPSRQSLWVERVAGPGDSDLWIVCDGGPDALRGPVYDNLRAEAEKCMAERAEVASFDVISPMRVTFLSGRTAELIGITQGLHRTWCAGPQWRAWMDTATRKGLVHVSGPLTAGPARAAGTIAVAIDAAWLGETESGAQVAVVEMVRELAKRPEIDRLVLVSEAGLVPTSLQGLAGVSGLTWTAALANAAPLVDIIHRPYQPGTDVDYRRYQRIAKSVALTVLDFIAYDNPEYHESPWAWRRYQQSFDESIGLADCVFAISRFVGARLEHQFAHQLAGPVRTALLGTDHLQSDAASLAPADLGDAVGALEQQPFLLVLGNDFEHKNRDFAVKVFVDVRERGYEGRLVLAGSHLDRGSSYGHELSGAGRHRESIIRMGAVSSAAKAWLLREAQVVLYPTSAEGFGLVPFEAAALGTPTAFVRFGPLCETLPAVDACPGWQVRPFADHVLRLLADPGSQLAQIRAASTTLTWSKNADQILAGYQYMLSAGAPWRTRARQPPTWPQRITRAADALAERAKRKLRRLSGSTS